MSQSAALTSLFARKGEASPSAGGGAGFSTPALAWEEDGPSVIQMRLPELRLTPAPIPTPKRVDGAPAKGITPPPKPPATPDALGRVRVAARLPERIYRIIRAQALSRGCSMADLLGAAVIGHLTGGAEGD